MNSWTKQEILDHIERALDSSQQTMEDKRVLSAELEVSMTLERSVLECRASEITVRQTFQCPMPEEGLL